MTKNQKQKIPCWPTVQNNAEILADFYKTQGIKTIFELNKGNHFPDNQARLSKEIKWILEE